MPRAERVHAALLAALACVTGLAWFDADMEWGKDEVVITYGDSRAVMRRKGELKEGRFMIFGADALKGAQLTVFSGIPLDRARDLYRRYPDFHRCDSPGAAEGQASVVPLKLLTRESATKQTLIALAEDFSRRLRNKGDRLCLGLEGYLYEQVEKQLDESLGIHYVPPELMLDDGALAVTAVQDLDCRKLLAQ